jgi:hypothetical protein
MTWLVKPPRLLRQAIEPARSEQGVDERFRGHIAVLAEPVFIFHLFGKTTILPHFSSPTLGRAQTA